MASRPRLAYVYHPRSFATMSLVEAARERCDVIWVIDTSVADSGTMARLLRRFGVVVDVAGLDLDEAAALVGEHSPTALLALADDCLVLAAELARRLGLSFASPELARLFTDKRLQREALARGGLPTPAQWLLSGPAAGFAFLEGEDAFPAVLKPRRGEASRDTLPVASYQQLVTLWESEGFARDGRAFVLEQYIADGMPDVAGESFAGYVSVETVVRDGDITHLAVNGRMPPAFPFRETGFFIPSALDDATAAQVLDTATRAAQALGVRSGCLHTEIKLSPTGPVVIEVNGRIGGGVPELLQLAAGVDLLGIAFDLALGRLTQLAVPTTNCVAYLFYVQSPPELHHVDEVTGLDDLRQVPGVREVTLNRGPGSDVSWRFGNHGHVFSVLGTAGDHDELRRLAARIPRLVEIRGS